MTERFHQGLGGRLIRKQLAPTNNNSAAGKWTAECSPSILVACNTTIPTPK